MFWPCHAACGILVPRPGIKPTSSALEAQNLNHWTTREVPQNKEMMRGALDGEGTEGGIFEKSVEVENSNSWESLEVLEISGLAAGLGLGYHPERWYNLLEMTAW